MRIDRVVVVEVASGASMGTHPMCESMPGQRATATDRSVSHRLARLTNELSAVEHELWLIVLATLTIDVYLTYVGLQAGLTEGNPLMHHAFETVGFAVLGLIKAVILGVAGFTREAWPSHGPYIPLGLSMPWLAAVLVNSSLLL
jgi:hypothetical protein